MLPNSSKLASSLWLAEPLDLTFTICNGNAHGNIRPLSSPAQPPGSATRQPASLPERAGARSSSQGAAWIAPGKRPPNSRLRQRSRSSSHWSWIWTRQPVFNPRAPSSSSAVGLSISYCSMQGWFRLRSAHSLLRASRRLRPRSSAIINSPSDCSAPTC